MVNSEIIIDNDITIPKIINDEYQNIRVIDGMICGTARMLFTTGVFYNLDYAGYSGRFCFDTQQNAELFLKDWNGETPPTIGIDGCKAIK